MQRLILPLTLLVLILDSTASFTQDVEYPGGISFAERKVDCKVAGPWNVAVAGDAIYWTNYAAGTITKMSMVGGNATTLVSGQKGICSIASDGTNLFWTNYNTGTVMTMTVSGSKVPSNIASEQDRPSVITISKDKGLQWITGDGKGTIIIPPVKDLPPGWVGKAGGGKDPGTVKCKICKAYCDVPQYDKNGKIFWKRVVCGEEPCDCGG